MREEMRYNPGYYQLREEQLERILSVAKNNRNVQSNGVVFFGDSITEMYNIEKYFDKIPIKYNCGIGGATSTELLWIIDEAVLKYKPKVVVLMIGTNDLGVAEMLSPKKIANNVKSIIDMIRGNSPKTHIILISTLPCIEEMRDYHHVLGIRCNDLAKMIYQEYQEQILDSKTIFVNAYSSFVDEKNQTLRHYYRDGLHINEKGYKLLTEILEPILLETYEET